MIPQILYRAPEITWVSRYKDCYTRISVLDTESQQGYRESGDFHEICRGSMKQVVGFRKLLREKYGNKSAPALEQLQFMWEMYNRTTDGGV